MEFRCPCPLTQIESMFGRLLILLVSTACSVTVLAQGMAVQSSRNAFAIRVDGAVFEDAREENLKIDNFSIARDNEISARIFALDLSYYRTTKSGQVYFCRLGLQRRLTGRSIQRVVVNTSSGSANARTEDVGVNVMTIYLSPGYQLLAIPEGRFSFGMQVETPLLLTPGNRFEATTRFYDGQQNPNGMLEVIFEFPPEFGFGIGLTGNAFYQLSRRFSFGIEVHGNAIAQIHNGTIYQYPTRYDANDDEVWSLSATHSFKTFTFRQNIQLFFSLRTHF